EGVGRQPGNRVTREKAHADALARRDEGDRRLDGSDQRLGDLSVVPVRREEGVYEVEPGIDVLQGGLPPPHLVDQGRQPPPPSLGLYPLARVVLGHFDANAIHTRAGDGSEASPLDPYVWFRRVGRRESEALGCVAELAAKEALDSVPFDRF